MHLALVTSEFAGEANAHGGLAAVSERLALALTRRGFRVTVVVCSDRDHEESLCPYRVLRVDTRTSAWIRILDRLTLHRFAVVTNAWSLGRSLRRALRNLHRREPVAVLHYPNLGGLALFAPRLPLLVRASCHRLAIAEAGDASLPRWHLALLHRLETACMRRADIAIAPSRITADRCAADSGRRVHAIPTVALISRPSGPPPDRGHDLLIAGTRSRLKGLDAVCALASTLLADHPDLHLTWIGADADAAGCDRLRGLDTDGRIHLERTLPRSQVLEAMRRCRVLLIPSRLDNLPNTLIEGLSTGAIVVATIESGAGQLIIDGVSGFLVRADDHRGMRRAIDTAWNLDAGRAAAMRAAAQATVSPRPRDLDALVAAYRLARTRWRHR